CGRAFLNDLFRAGLNLGGVALGFLLRIGADGGLVPVGGVVGYLVLDIDLGGGVEVGAAVDVGIDERGRDLGHAGGLAVAGAGEDHVFHAGAAQRLGRLLTQDPGDGVRDVRLAAA